MCVTLPSIKAIAFYSKAHLVCDKRTEPPHTALPNENDLIEITYTEK